MLALQRDHAKLRDPARLAKKRQRRGVGGPAQAIPSEAALQPLVEPRPENRMSMEVAVIAGVC